MRRVCVVLLFGFLGGAGVLGCSLSDADRCPSGFVYQKDTKVCALISDAAPAVVEDAAVATPAVDAEPAPASEAGVSATSSFGAACTGNAECASAATNFCVMLPGSPGGYCSKAQCTTECPTGYQCCNCPAFSLVVCLKDADAAAASAAMGCSCN
jgi:hypothetical protein